MDREEAIKILKEHHDHWMRLHKEGICTEEEGENTIEALEMAIKALEQEPCKDAISRQAVLDILKREGHKWGNDYRDWVDAIEEIKNLSPVNPTKTGHWIVDRDDSRRWDKVRFYCSECGRWQTYGRTDYCPSCGAKMIEPQERSGEE